MKLLILFIVFNALNVIIQTIKSLATIKCGKTVAALINAIAYGLYVYITILTVCDLPLWQKMLIVALCNFVGVFIVKWVEEKARKDKLWLVKMTIPKENAIRVQGDLKNANIPFSWIDIDKYVIFDTYCNTQQDTANATLICKIANGKMFATENKLGL